MLRRFRADLHVHTCLSPCGDLLMSPLKIAAQAEKRQIRVLAICDHNSAENVPAVRRAAELHKIVVLPGLEICSREEIHVLAIFEKLESAFEMQSIVYDRLPGKNDPGAFGLQVVSNELDEVVAFQDKLLIGAVEMTVESVVDEIHRLGGVAIASHIDRESYSVMSQLAFIPETLKFDALELSCHIEDEEARARYMAYSDITFIRNSDAHFLGDIGNNTREYMLEYPTFAEIQKALRREDGRRVCE
jgi:predicted metal-dependent phosphoesterase TrpH